MPLLKPTHWDLGTRMAREAEVPLMLAIFVHRDGSPRQDAGSIKIGRALLLP